MESGGSSKIRVHGTNHQGTIFTIFDKLFTTQSLVDVTIAAEGKFLRAHQVILSACSPYFEDLLAIDSSKHPILFMSPDVKFIELKALLDYLYKGETFIQQNDLPSLLKLAQYLQIRGLTETDEDSERNTETSQNVTNVEILPGGGNGFSKTSSMENSHQTSKLSGNCHEESQNVANHSAVQLTDPPESFLFNRVQQLTNEQVPGSSTSAVNRKSGGTKRPNRDLHHVSSNFISTPSSTTSTFTPHSTALLQYSKRTCPEKADEPLTFSCPSQFITGSIEGDESAPPRDYSFIDESSIDHLDMLKNSIKVEEVIPEEMITVSSDDDPSASSSQQNWILQDTSRSNQGMGGLSQDLDETCENQTGDTEGLVSSVRGINNRECPSCNRTYKSKASLIRHVRYECNLPPKFQCSMCGRKVKLKSNLLAHERRCRLRELRHSHRRPRHP